jgi:hypothetical protein
MTFEMLIADPLTRAVMDSDGIDVSEMIALFERILSNRVQRGLAAGSAIA